MIKRINGLYSWAWIFRAGWVEISKVTYTQVSHPQALTPNSQSLSLEQSVVWKAPVETATRVEERESVMNVSWHISCSSPSVRSEDQIQKEKDKCEGLGDEKMNHWDCETPSEGDEACRDTSWKACTAQRWWAWPDGREEDRLPREATCYRGLDLDAGARLPEFKSNLSLLTRSRNRTNLLTSLCLCFPVKWE